MIVWALGACSSVVAPLYTTGERLDGETPSLEAQKVVGSVFYPDLRTLGHFSWRQDLYGNPGQKCSFAEDECVDNPLGAWGIEVLARDSQRREFARTRVLRDGTFSFGVDKAVELEIIFLLRYCTEKTCFQFRDDEFVYGLSHPDSPVMVTEEGVALTPMLFQEEGVSAGTPNNHAHSANHFASLMELGCIWHGFGDASFYTEEFPPLDIILPTHLDTFGRTTGPSTVHIPENTAGWIKGNKIMHEYGHVLSLRAWGGTYWFDGEPFADWSAVTPQEPHIAFKEGFANFVSRSAETEQSCSGSFDKKEPLGSLEDGYLYPRNVTKLLCDLFDNHGEEERDEELYFTLSFFLESLEGLLERSQQEDDRYLSICTLVDFWAESNIVQSDQIYAVALLNNITCQ